MTVEPMAKAVRKLAEEREKKFGRLLSSIWPLGLESMATSQARTKSVAALEDAVRGFIAEAVDLTTHTPQTSRAFALVDDEVASLLSKLEERLLEHEFFASRGLVSPYSFRTEFQQVRSRIAGRLVTYLSEHRSAAKPVTKTGGRPGKWKWEGALIHLIAVANTPDGLPDGEGAQARIGEMMADWFAANSDDGSTPADSEIKIRARLIIKELGR